MTPEQQARQQIDAKLVAAGWIVQDYKAFTLVPKTLIFTKDNFHADDIVCICHKMFDKCNDFCKKNICHIGFVRIVAKKPQPGGSELEEITWKRASSLSDDEILSTFDQLG
jgi:hypothetical protein